MNAELLKGKVQKGELGSGDCPCKDSNELAKVAKKYKDTIIWCLNFEASEKSLSYARQNNNLLRIIE